MFFLMWFVPLVLLLDTALIIFLAIKFGWLPILALTLFFSIIGRILIRIAKLRLSGKYQIKSILNTFVMLGAGWLLFIPGFITDLLALCFFIPLFRKLLIQMIFGPALSGLRMNMYSSPEEFDEEDDCDCEHCHPDVRKARVIDVDHHRAKK